MALRRLRTIAKTLISASIEWTSSSSSTSLYLTSLKIKFDKAYQKLNKASINTGWLLLFIIGTDRVF